MKRKILVSVLLASMLTGSVYAKDNNLTKEENIKLVNTKAVKDAKNSAVKDKKESSKEAVESLVLARKVLFDLEKNDLKSASKDIEKALGKIELLLATGKTPKMVSVDGSIVVKEYVERSEDVKKSVKSVKKLLDDGKVQEARVLLNTLQSQMDITVVNLPLESYPDALKLAAKYIDQNKPDQAKEIMSVALSTFYNITQIVPLPLVKATDLIAYVALHSKDDEKLRADELLEEAEDQLKVAEYLGYVSKGEVTYKRLHSKIQEIRKEIKGENKTKKLFDMLLDDIKEFKSKIFSSSK
jgi:hypothetical protein